MPDEEMLVRAAIRDELTGPLREIRDELKATAKEADGAGRKANLGARGFDAMARGAGKFVKVGLTTALKAGAAGLAAMVTAASVGSVKLLQMASDAAETASAFKTVFKGVSGDVAGYVRRMNKEFGITTRELRTAATTFGVFGKAAGVSKKDLGGFTKDLVSAGLDLSSFYNADPTEVFQALRSGLAGEAEPLRQFGIFLSDAAMQAKAAQMGLTGELTESQKVMVRQAIIMKSLGDAEGDLARTKDGLANKTRALKGRLAEAGTVIGTALLPYATKLASKLDTALGPAIDRLPAKLAKADRMGRKLVDAWQAGGPDAAVNKLDKMTGAGGRLNEIWAKTKDVADDVVTIVKDGIAPAFVDVANILPDVLQPVTLLDDVLSFLADHTDLVRGVTVALIAVLTTAKAISLGMAAATTAYATAQKIAATASKVWAAGQWLLNAALTANPIGLIIVGIAALIAIIVLIATKTTWFQTLWEKAWGAIKAGAGFVLDFLKNNWPIILAILTGPIGLAVLAIAKNWDKIKDGASAVIDWVKGIPDKLADLASSFGDAGKTLIGAFLDGLGKAAGFVGGLAEAVWGAVKGAINGGLEKLNDLLEFTIKLKGLPDVDVNPPDLGPIGDTRTSRARGTAAGMANTLAAHQRATAVSGARPRITNALVGGGGLGHGSGDHQAGRALDLTGRGLAGYAKAIRAAGGYAAFHGTGSSRHLHAVPAGDTNTSRARAVRRPSGAGGRSTGTTIEAGAVVVHVTNPGTNVDVAQAVADGIRSYLDEREERE